MDNYWIDPFLYVNVYYAALGIATLWILIQSDGTLLKQFNWGALLLVGAIVVYWANRPITTEAGLVDTKVYAHFFTSAQEEGVDVLDYKDMGFMFVMEKLLPFSLEFFFGVLAFLYIGPYTLAYKRIYHDKFGLALIILICSFSFFGYGVNGIRNGIALSFVTLAISFCDTKKWLFLLLCLIGISFHKSATLPIVALCIAQCYKNSDVYLKIWIACIIISLFAGNILASIIPDDFMGDERLSDYLNSDFGDQEYANFSHTGFRFDFILYSLIPIIIGRKFLGNSEEEFNFYRLVYNVYLICNSFWILTIYVPYNNRFAYLSWFLYPVLITYPFVKETDWMDNKIKSVALLNYLFTFFMFLKG